MAMSTRLGAALNNLIVRGGAQLRVQYFTTTIGSVWDDDVTLAQSGGDHWTSGLILPLDLTKGSWDSILLEQGKIILDDKKIFIHGSLALTGSEMQVTFRIGSPGTDVSNQYTILDSVIRVEVQNTPIYKKVFIRQIGGVGSLLGES